MFAEKPRGSSFQRNYYQQPDSHLGLRGTRRRKNKTALSANVSTVNQKKGEGDADETLAKDNNNIFDPVVKPISPHAKENSCVKEEQVQLLEGKGTVATRKKLSDAAGGSSSGGAVRKRDSQKENFIPSSSSRCQYHSSFVLKRPTGYSSGRGKDPVSVPESKSNQRSRSSSHSHKSCSFNRKKKPNQQEPSYYHHHTEEEDSGSHDSAQYYPQCHVDPVMTWFKEPSGAEDPYENNKG